MPCPSAREVRALLPALTPTSRTAAVLCASAGGGNRRLLQAPRDSASCSQVQNGGGCNLLDSEPALPYDIVRAGAAHDAVLGLACAAAPSSHWRSCRSVHACVQIRPIQMVGGLGGNPGVVSFCGEGRGVTGRSREAKLGPCSPSFRCTPRPTCMRNRRSRPHELRHADHDVVGPVSACALAPWPGTRTRARHRLPESDSMRARASVAALQEHAQQQLFHGPGARLTRTCAPLAHSLTMNQRPLTSWPPARRTRASFAPKAARPPQQTSSAGGRGGGL